MPEISRLRIFVTMTKALIAVLAFAILETSCMRTQPTKDDHADRPCTTRYLPVGDNPDIALDTQTGMLCRTFEDPVVPVGPGDPACGVTEEQKERAFVPHACKTGQTWVQIDQHSARYTAVHSCNKH